MKIVVMSDTHLNKVNDHFADLCQEHCQDADLVLHLGDWVSPSVADFLEQFHLEGVAGNMDPSPIRNRFPLKKTIRAGSFRLGIIHGWGGTAHDMKSSLLNEFSDVNAILFGHTHQPFQSEENGILWFNPGSVFMGRGKLAKSLGILWVGRSLEAEIVPL
jgi:putative phosphoesterase